MNTLAPDLCLLAHGEVMKLFGPLLLMIILIVGSVINCAIAIPIASFVGWRCLRSKRKRLRFALGLGVFLALFLGLWLLEAIVFVMNVDISNRPVQ